MTSLDVTQDIAYRAKGHENALQRKLVIKVHPLLSQAATVDRDEQMIVRTTITKMKKQKKKIN